MTYYLILLLFIFFNIKGTAQISPGELSNAHAHLEGIKNCTKCHILKDKKTSSKCLECHKEIQQLINQNKGYHASADVKGKECAECHGEHFGRDFDITRFDKNSFNHNLTGYQLEGKHAEIDCAHCHKPELIQNNISQKKENTYLGLGTSCLSCHHDYHQKTLSDNCVSCHNQNAFRPAGNFDHGKTQFPLIGKHKDVDCIKCHEKTQKNGHDFQEFAGVAFANCTNCHLDVHNNKFGKDCRKCHDEFSFKQVKSMNSFNHDNTDYPLRGMHQGVDCKKCHKGSFTRAVQHGFCTDCHNDYHEGQFAKEGKTRDCSECHSVQGFTPANYTIEKHNLAGFKLEGAHLATPCYICHKPENKWIFTGLDTNCIDCHQNIHENYIPEKYLPENNCAFCHYVSSWAKIDFNHQNTSFELQGKHNQVTCRKCHFNEVDGEVKQQFSDLANSCENCHVDVHFKQFVVEGINDCERCHWFENWKPEKFDHNKTRFVLDGEHAGLACVKCHKPTDGLIQNYIIYKFEDISCASCH